MVFESIFTVIDFCYMLNKLNIMDRDDAYKLKDGIIEYYNLQQ